MVKVATAGTAYEEYEQEGYDGGRAGSAWPSYYGHGEDNGESFETVLVSDVGYKEGEYGETSQAAWPLYYGYWQGGYGGRPFGADEASDYGYKQGSGYQDSRPGVRSIAAESYTYGLRYGEAAAADTENNVPIPDSTPVTNVKRLYTFDAASGIGSASSSLVNGGTSALPQIISILSKSVDKSGLKEYEVLVKILIEASTACMHVLSSFVIGNVGSEVQQSVADTVSQSLTKV